MTGPQHPLLIGHRGASGYAPEHTLLAYFLAIEQGADFVEPDLVLTRDGALVARHENEIGATTDVASKTQFAARHTTKLIDGAETSGWFTEDFTLAELKTLRARERLPQLRPQNARLDGQFEIATLEEILALVNAVNESREHSARRLGVPPPPQVGIYPETKHPGYFQSLGPGLEKPLIAALKQYGYRGVDAPVFIQSFEVGNLRQLHRMTRIRLVQLLDERGAPQDFIRDGDMRSYADLCTPQGLREIATYASAVGVHKNLILPRADDASLESPSTLVMDAHAAGLAVHAWSFRAENQFLPPALRNGTDPAAVGRLEEELRLFLMSGVDGLFLDQPDIGRRVLGARR